MTPNDVYYNKTPSLDDKVHVLVCVYSANVPKMDDNVLRKMTAIREAASSLGKKSEVCGEGRGLRQSFVDDSYSL